jgi:CheY-like chemotaxis protein
VYKKVLVVDDDAGFLTIIKKIIISWGYDVVTASNCKEALAVFAQEKPDILVLDYVMPDINGLEVLRKIRSAGGVITPAIIFAAEPTIRLMEAGKKLNVLAFISKINLRRDTYEDLKTILNLVTK